MTLLSRAVANTRRELRSGQFGDSSIPPNSAFPGVSGSGMVTTEQGALGISTVMACARVLFSDMRVLSFAAYQGSRQGARQPIANQPLIVTQPFGPDLARGVGMGQIAVSISMRGNAYVQAVSWDANAYVTQAQVVHPDRVRVKLDDSGRKVFSVANGPWVDGTVVKQIMGLSLPGSLVGLDPITYMRVSLGLAADVAQFGANFFSNGGSPSGVISVKGPGTATNAREVKDIWEAGHAGVVNAHRPAVLFGGATWTPLSVDPENAQFLETRGFSREEICGWFGVPLQRIQAIVDHASQGGGTGLDTIDQGYVTHTLQPLTVSIEEIWDTFVPGGQSTWTLFNFDDLLRTTPKVRADIAQIHRLTGVRNRNEIRGDEGWAPIDGPDGTDYNVPLNSSSVVVPVPDPSDPTNQPAPPADGGQ